MVETPILARAWLAPPLPALPQPPYPPTAKLRLGDAAETPLAGSPPHSLAGPTPGPSLLAADCSVPTLGGRRQDPNRVDVTDDE